MTGRTADLPLEKRREQEAENRREINDGLLSRHCANAQFERSYLAAHYRHLLDVGPALSAKLRGR